MFNPYVKAVIAAVLAGLGSVATALDDNVLTTSDVVVAIGVFVGGFALVWATTTGKEVIGALVAGLGSLGTALLEGGVSLQEGVTIAVVALTALVGVSAVTNAPEPKANPQP